MTWTSEVKTSEVFVCLDDTPLWVRVSAIDVVQPYLMDRRKTEVILRNGQSVYTATKTDEVLTRMTTAAKGPTS